MTARTTAALRACSQCNTLGHRRDYCPDLRAPLPTVATAERVPRACPRCGKALVEDDVFTAQMRVYNLPQRRYRCVMAHSVMVGMPDLTALRARATVEEAHAAGLRTLHRAAEPVTRLCPRCGRSWLAYNHVDRARRYCSTACAFARGSGARVAVVPPRPCARVGCPEIIRDQPAGAERMYCGTPCQKMATAARARAKARKVAAGA